MKVNMISARIINTPTIFNNRLPKCSPNAKTKNPPGMSEKNKMISIASFAELA